MAKKKVIVDKTRFFNRKMQIKCKFLKKNVKKQIKKCTFVIEKIFIVDKTRFFLIDVISPTVAKILKVTGIRKGFNSIKNNLIDIENRYRLNKIEFSLIHIG